MDDDELDAAMARLGQQVDQAHTDVRRAESVGPAMTVGLVAACLPLLMVVVFVGVNWFG